MVFTTAGNLSEQAVALGKPFPCSSPLTLRWLLPAAWQLEVSGQDAAGKAAPPLRRRWTVALEAAAGPVTRFTRCVLARLLDGKCATMLLLCIIA